MVSLIVVRIWLVDVKGIGGDMTELEKLRSIVKRYSELSDKREDLDVLIVYESSKCDNLDSTTIINGCVMTTGDTCLQLAYDYLKEEREEPSEYGYTLSMSFDDALLEVEACDHCIASRQAKKDKYKVALQLNAVKAQITKLGRKL